MNKRYKKWSLVSGGSSSPNYIPQPAFIVLMRYWEKEKTQPFSNFLYNLDIRPGWLERVINGTR